MDSSIVWAASTSRSAERMGAHWIAGQVDQEIDGACCVVHSERIKRRGEREGDLRPLAGVV